MIEINSPHEIEKHLNTPLTPSDWYEITQEKINIFAEATGEFQWIHVDVERAKKEMPEGKTIAHGYYILSLISLLSSQTAKINNSSRTLNYCSDKVRYINPVKVDSLVRLNRKIIKVNLMENGGYRMINIYEMEIKDAKRTADIAETISIVLP